MSSVVSSEQTIPDFSVEDDTQVHCLPVHRSETPRWMYRKGVWGYQIAVNQHHCGIDCKMHSQDVSISRWCAARWINCPIKNETHLCALVYFLAFFVQLVQEFSPRFAGLMSCEVTGCAGLSATVDVGHSDQSFHPLSCLLFFS